MENIKETYDKLLQAGDLTNEQLAMEEENKLTDNQIIEITDTLNKAVEENANLKVIADLPSNNGVLEAESDLVGEDKLVNVKINPTTGEKVVVGTLEENDEEDNFDLFEDIVDDNVEGVNIDDIELSKEAVSKTIEEKFTREFNEEETLVLVNLLNEYRKNKSIDVYAKLPQSFKRMIDSTLAKEGVPYNLVTNVRKSMAKELIDDLLFETYIDNYQIELNKEIEKVFGGVRQEFRDMSIKMTKEQIEQLIKVEPQIREKDIDKADTLLKIIDSMKNSFSYEILYNAIKDRKLGKIRKIDLEKPEKIYNKFNRLYETSVYNIYDLKLLPNILRKILPEDISIEDIHKFLIYFCKYCDMNNLNPAVLEEHAFMYYSVLNIVLLSLSSKSEEEDNSTEEIVENITKVIKLFD